MVAKKNIAPELLAEAKRLYEQTLAPVGDIAQMVGLSRSNFYERVREGGWRSRRARPTFSLARAICASVRVEAGTAPPEASRITPVSSVAFDLPQQRIAVAQRIMATVEREMDAIERILQVITPADQLEAEHGARTLASLSRTLRDIAALNRPDDEMPRDEDDDNDLVPRDIDEFRNELARRIEALIASDGASETSENSGGAAGPLD